MGWKYGVALACGLRILRRRPIVAGEWDSPGHAAGSHSSGPTMNSPGVGELPFKSPSETVKGAGQTHNRLLDRGPRHGPSRTSWTQLPNLASLGAVGANPGGGLLPLVSLAGRRRELFRRTEVAAPWQPPCVASPRRDPLPLPPRL